MTIDEFMAIAPMFASEDVIRRAFRTPFRFGDHMFVTDGRIALACRFPCAEIDMIEETADRMRKDIGKQILRDHIKVIEAKIESCKYCGYGLCSISEAVVAVFANIEPEMLMLRARVPDDEDPIADGSPDTVRYVHETLTAVIMANPARSIIAGYYASLIAALVRHHGPVEAYADMNDPHAELYFRGANWHCVLMPRLTRSRDIWWDFYGGCAISDASTGELVWARNTDESPDIDTLRAGRPKIEVEVAK